MRRDVAVISIVQVSGRLVKARVRDAGLSLVGSLSIGRVRDFLLIKKEAMSPADSQDTHTRPGLPQ